MKRRLGVNIDHIATLRQVRRVTYPAPVAALPVLAACGVDQVTIHLREDRRHIQDRDLEKILRAGLLPVNLEMAVTDEMVAIALARRPQTATFVPEKRQEVTTEGGLDCVRPFKRVAAAVSALKEAGIRVSLFVDPDREQILAAKETGADGVEIHTGTYCDVIEKFYEQSGSYDFTTDVATQRRVETELQKMKEAAQTAVASGLKAFAGHGLHKDNLAPVVKIREIEEYNIGHAIIARAVFVGLKGAVEEIQRILVARDSNHQPLIHAGDSR